jgi:hypothetical protein
MYSNEVQKVIKVITVFNSSLLGLMTLVNLKDEPVLFSTLDIICTGFLYKLPLFFLLGLKLMLRRQRSLANS